MKAIFLLLLIAIGFLCFNNFASQATVKELENQLSQEKANHSNTKARLDTTTAQLERANVEIEKLGLPKIRPATKSQPLPWIIPRTITTTDGRVYQNVTILGLSPDGGVTINYGPNAIKLTNGSLDAKTVQDIVAAQTLKRQRQ